MIIPGFGNPGCGKTTLAAFVVARNEKRKNKYYKKLSKSKLYKWLTEPIEMREEFYCYFKEKVNGKVITYSINQDVPYTRKDNNPILRMLYNFLYPKNFYDVIYSTDETIKNTIYISYDDLGTWKPTWNSLFILDEAGIGLNNRNFKNLSNDAKELFALHRHKGADMLIISQTVDIDKAARQRANNMFMARKFGPFTATRMINYRVGVNKETHTLEDMYTEQHWIIWLWQLLTCWRKKYRNEKLPFTRSLVFLRQPYYKYFDSYNDTHIYTNKDPYESYKEKLNKEKLGEEVESSKKEGE